MGIGGAIAGVAGSILGGNAQRKSADKARRSASATAKANLKSQEELAAQQREDFTPWREYGERNLAQLDEMMKAGAFDPTKFQHDLQTDPGYQFRKQEGINALDASAASRGRLQSGAQQKAIAKFGQGIASDEFQNSYNRALQSYKRDSDEKARKYNMLSQASNSGQSAAAQQAGATGQLANTTAAILSNKAATDSQGYLAAGQAQSNMYGGLATSVNQGIENYQINQGNPSSASKSWWEM